MAAPLFYLCRHSVELSIKGAINTYAQTLGVAGMIAGHSLADLWAEFLRLLQKAGFNIDDEWTVYCGKLVSHLDEVDPDGERFRYPSSRRGTPFEFTRVEVRHLAVAHWHIGMMCDACEEMLSELGPNAPEPPSA
jgi:hypothetical protein